MMTKEQIVETVSDVFGVPVEAIMGDDKSRRCAHPRQMAIYLVHDLGNVSTTFTGLFFNRDHTTILYAIRRVEHWLETNENFREKHRAILSKLAELRSAA